VKLDVRYIAGLFDGEGWFQIDRSKPFKRWYGSRKSVAHQVRARITMRDQKLLRALRARFGGSLRQSSQETERRASYWSWDLCGENAYKFAVIIGPHLLLKVRQATLVKRFQRLKRKNKNSPMTPVRSRQLMAMYERMKVLNKKGVSR